MKRGRAIAKANGAGEAKFAGPRKMSLACHIECARQALL